MLLPQQRQRADALDDVVFHAGRRAARNESRDRPRPGNVRTCVARQPSGRNLPGNSSASPCRADGNQSLRETFEFLSRGTGAVAESATEARPHCSASLGVLREQSAEVVIAARGFDVEQQRVVVTNDNSRSENRFDAGLLCRLDELHRAVQVAGVGQCHGRHAVLLGQFTMAFGESVESRNE